MNFSSSGSDPRANVSHEVSVNPVDDDGIDISHLEQRWNLEVSVTAIDPNHVSHTPCSIRARDDQVHSRLDLE